MKLSGPCKPVWGFTHRFRDWGRKAPRPVDLFSNVSPLPLTTTCLNRQEVCSHRFRPQHRPISRHPQLRLRSLRHRNYPLLRAFRAQKTRSESEQPIARYACIFGVLTQAPIFSVLPTFCFAEAAILRPFVRQRHAWKALNLPYSALSSRQGFAFRKMRELLHICGTLVLVWPWVSLPLALHLVTPSSPSSEGVVWALPYCMCPPRALQPHVPS